MTRDELVTALLRERFEAPRSSPTHPVPADRGAGIPDQHQRIRYLRRLAGYGWTARQIAAVVGMSEAYVARVIKTEAEGSEAA